MCVLFEGVLYSREVWQVDSLVNCLEFAQLKPSKNPLADLFIHQTFFHQTLEKSKFAPNFLPVKLSCIWTCTIFVLSVFTLWVIFSNYHDPVWLH